MPLLQVLGYDVFDPREVRPEYIADFAVKKAGQFEKIDYAIFINQSPARCERLTIRYYKDFPVTSAGIIWS